MDSPLIVLAFLSIFHVVGGGGLGVALRGFRQGEGSVPLVIWALLFSGIPLLMGLGIPWIWLIQLSEMLIACVVTFFFWDRICAVMGKSSVLLVLCGGIVFVVGSAVAGLLLKQGDYVPALAFGLLFVVVGLLFVYFGLRTLFKPPANWEE